MKNLLRLEELAQFLLCLCVLAVMWNTPWWAYPLLLVGPDIGMLGYLINEKVGAIAYNVLHHKGIAILVWVLGLVCAPFTTFMFLEGKAIGHELLFAGIILYGHASMDRIFGYGLKFGDNFHHTHLGWIGKMKQASTEKQAGQ